MRWVGRLRRVAGAIAVLLVMFAVVVAATTISAGHLTEPRNQHQSVLDVARAELASRVSFVPSPGADGVAPDAPVVVTTYAGRLAGVRVTSSNGDPVRGQLAKSAKVWRAHGFLDYGREYRVTAIVGDATNVRAASSMTFRTLQPTTAVTATVFPTAGMSVGVGQPVVFTFSQPIDPAAQASVYQHLVVHGTKKIAGGWHWFNDHELHFRPKAFWPADEHVTVDWNLNGWNVGGGAWGMGGGTTHFDVGLARVSFADLATHQMTVTVNGITLATFPLSGGRATDPTMGGVHIVMDRESVVRMNSATNGVPVDSPDGYDELVYSNVHISDSGEYVHAAPWSVASQGNANVSHGCINLSPEAAQTFMNFSRVGDVVVVTNSPRAPEVGDHGVMDWSTPWSEFTPAR